MHDDFLAHVLDLVEPLAPVSLRRLFGAMGLFVDGQMFAFVDDGQVFLKVDDVTRPEFQASHCEPFLYEGKNGSEVSLGYYLAPEEALEDPEAMRPWATLAIAAARRAIAAKTQRAARRSERVSRQKQQGPKKKSARRRRS